MSIKIKMENILSPYFPDGLDFTRSLEDQGLDSLSTIDIVLSIEEVFDLELPDSEFNEENFYSAESLVKMIAGITGI